MGANGDDDEDMPQSVRVAPIEHSRKMALWKVTGVEHQANDVAQT